jgi:methylenetetrahydrofolate dehydrogenase (NADP+)/methenyltetrahydrofolate cyclohydrolase
VAIIDGKKISSEMREELKKEIAVLKASGCVPGLATILVGEDPASHVYVNNKIKACKELGIASFHHQLPCHATNDAIIALIRSLNDSPDVHAILLQLPLPDGLNAGLCIQAISPQKDVDGLHPYNQGLLLGAKSWKDMVSGKLLMPCTPYGSIVLLQKYGVNINGARAVVVGRSALAGKPIALMLLANNATVTIAHSRTHNLAGVCREADILIAAIGKPKFVTKDFVKPGAAVIDIGINRANGGLCGDVDYDALKDVAGYITPVPGGVGAMTITMLMKNTLLAAKTAPHQFSSSPDSVGFNDLPSRGEDEGEGEN